MCRKWLKIYIKQYKSESRRGSVDFTKSIEIATYQTNQKKSADTNQCCLRIFLLEGRRSLHQFLLTILDDDTLVSLLYLASAEVEYLAASHGGFCL